MTIKIITVGNKTPENITKLIVDYTKRMPRHINIDWHYIKHAGAGDAATSKQQESESILKALPSEGTIILLDERGKQLTNQKLSRKLFADSADTVIIIGGAHGVSRSVMERADFIWSLSDLVFPHQIVRLILTEQIYRSYTISIDHPYHHN